jgi:hypothetical protein
VNAVVHPVAWAAPRPLWSAGGGGRGLAPSLLRFATDDFMDQLQAVLAHDPGRIGQFVARPETWRTAQGGDIAADLVDRVPLPAPMKRARLFTRLKTAPAAPPPPAPDRVLKLYQPAHQRYYIATATLACALPGMPDRKPQGPHEQLGYVVRRLLPLGGGGGVVEHALVKDADGARWRRLAGDDPAELAPGEERNGVFPLMHHDRGDLRRTVWGALVPVGRREEYLAASVDTAQPGSLVTAQIAALGSPAPASRPNSKLARLSELRMDFIEPWKAMVQSAIKAAADIAGDTGDGSSGTKRQTQVRERNLQYQTQSWLLLADLWSYLGRHLPTLRDALHNADSIGLSTREKDIYDWSLETDPSSERTSLANGFKPFSAAASEPPYANGLGAALRTLAGTSEAQFEAMLAKLEANELLYTDSAAHRADWPGFHYLLAGIASNGAGDTIAAKGPYLRVGSAPTPPAGEAEIAGVSPPLTQPAPAPGFDVNQIDRLAVMVGRALPVGNEANARPLPFAQRLSQTLKDTDYDTGLFVVRFVHLNADCGPLHPPTLSEPSERFRMASFFDPDAPARPIRISLPMDTSPAGLRKHAKGTAFVLSNMLCGQVQRAKGLGFIDLVRQVLPWPLHKDIDVGEGGGCKSGGVDIGMICSISIPIITLCALLLLMIIVSLLDFIFRWLPWFIMCFPVPGLKGKPSAGGAA